MEEQNISELRKLLLGPQRVWDNVVPIVKYDKTIEAFITNDVESPAYYDELCYELDQASSDTTFIIHLNTLGGVIDTAKRIYNCIKQSNAAVYAKCTGSVCSAGTMIALAADELYIAPFTSFMIHNYSGGVVGKGHEMKAQQAFTDKELALLFDEIYGDFLTKDEITSVIDGKDLWMGSDEVMQRWNRKQQS